MELLANKRRLRITKIWKRGVMDSCILKVLFEIPTRLIMISRQLTGASHINKRASAQQYCDCDQNVNPLIFTADAWGQSCVFERNEVSHYADGKLP